jgi:hypothetical protein
MGGRAGFCSELVEVMLRQALEHTDCFDFTQATKVLRQPLQAQTLFSMSIISL